MKYLAILGALFFSGCAASGDYVEDPGYNERMYYAITGAQQNYSNNINNMVQQQYSQELQRQAYLEQVKQNQETQSRNYYELQGIGNYKR